ncbi:hypothetical protein PsorP6_015581 [Peronosclerospora sorghi]|uniref:Uncharacterized protein n=1 Tax=Peronosclerospora sorghi TaxID=230839 RepID=A0ACC0WN94_9STRA|nr:hypothetical protein PsorP6_015581 [Peronosclerospora sorghi]
MIFNGLLSVLQDYTDEMDFVERVFVFRVCGFEYCLVHHIPRSSRPSCFSSSEITKNSSKFPMC